VSIIVTDDTLSSHPEKLYEYVYISYSSHTESHPGVKVRQLKSIVVESTFAFVVIDQDGPASYPERPKTLVTNN
jgi:hypothetical protein